MTVRTRYAPSPTGYLHIGGLRTALYNFLFARRFKGAFILRIEDTDQERLVQGATQKMIDMFEGLGLTPDEGPAQGGPYGPYIQSERNALYAPHAETLLKKGSAYYCFCSEERLQELRALQQERGNTSKYDQKCLSLPKEEIDKRLAKGDAHVIRLHIPGEKQEITFHDLIRGEIAIPTAELDDQILIKSDGLPTYHLANVVDDHLMEITHVIRGEEWIASTPKHILLYEAFGWKMPQFAHVPLLLNPDKTKLSKRQGSVAVEEFLGVGYLGEALINFVALLGWNPRGDQEIYTLNELIETFDIAKVNKGGAVVNFEKFDWFNSEYIKRLSEEEFIERATPFLRAKGLTLPAFVVNDPKKRALWVVIEKQRINKLNAVGEETACVFQPPSLSDAKILPWKKSTPQKTRDILSALHKYLKETPEDTYVQMEAELKQWITTQGYGAGEVLWPLRVALSGKAQSPGPFELLALLGKQKSLEYVFKALQALGA